VGAVDVKPELRGNDLGVLADGWPPGCGSARRLQSRAAGTADVVVHCAGSHLARRAEQVLEASHGRKRRLDLRGARVPWFHHRNEAQRIDEAARDAGRPFLQRASILDLQWTPGALCVGHHESVTGVRVHRAQEAGTRREPLQRKVGAGITSEEFDARKAAARSGMWVLSSPSR